MTTTIKGHFDGRVIVPDSPVDLPRDTPLTIHVESDDSLREPEFGTAGYLLKHIQPIDDQSAAEMRQAIEEACEQIEPDPDINLD